MTAVVVSGAGRVFDGGSGAGTVALTDVDLTVGEGELVSLIGPSGCGKSTLLRLIADLDAPTSGSVAVFGKTAERARKDQDYGIAFQQAGLLPWRSVRANVELPMQLRGAGGLSGRAERAARSAELLALVGLTDFADHRPHQLSGGMQQRVAIARALARSPRLLLMDEPFGALDEMTRERLQDELLRIRAATGAAVVFVTHSIAEAVYLSDRVVVMSPRPGRVVATLDVPLGGPADRVARGIGLREDPAYFERVSAVREVLHSGDAASDRVSS
ncbi:NitT/TauT family transport system ATP-binding protein [Promicromonospora sp. AC04]|uniref:ABC transporter ATP-binding protein n=1 Tax=Promicromonospora sp. AC04 TaxID=2135723 RepID=UPI000D3C45D7|nr:ABC transporter ATP-binding protein [Promicromonospora sp. AC04]PUB31797.1 NitT/TauT family transport system ATP-binding protein [Promicromonospora sp. AC04]